MLLFIFWELYIENKSAYQHTLYFGRTPLKYVCKIWIPNTVVWAMPNTYSGIRHTLGSVSHIFPYLRSAGFSGPILCTASWSGACGLREDVVLSQHYLCYPSCNSPVRIVSIPLSTIHPTIWLFNNRCTQGWADWSLSCDWHLLCHMV